jgi:hypothetical protein
MGKGNFSEEFTRDAVTRRVRTPAGNENRKRPENAGPFNQNQGDEA